MEHNAVSVILARVCLRLGGEEGNHKRRKINETQDKEQIKATPDQ
jgi:hypothetical protein